MSKPNPSFPLSALTNRGAIVHFESGPQVDDNVGWFLYFTVRDKQRTYQLGLTETQAAVFNDVELKTPYYFRVEKAGDDFVTHLVKLVDPCSADLSIQNRMFIHLYLAHQLQIRYRNAFGEALDENIRTLATTMFINGNAKKGMGGGDELFLLATVALRRPGYELIKAEYPELFPTPEAASPSVSLSELGEQANGRPKVDGEAASNSHLKPPRVLVPETVEAT